ncbi:hypothetical protein GCM10011344_28770 [Dokdonia pacifica]|uniref:Uncharacterized protein n=1 Tax=Dokdonia pacifica TaxID=1627892 RepID=A0A239C7I2_9FLAO|nr:hypothetical protein [Dokdonia pacifica]GGG26311.1 hypothetical protein GCM10011344_28770 [Dokdonia pacifica]SNS16070.1 hypothetical protein SAMN06265376_107166 [Dokdonia pacifica]
MRTGTQPEIKASQLGAAQQNKKAKKAVALQGKKQQKATKGVPPSLDEVLFGAPQKVNTTGIKDSDFNAQQVGQLAADPTVGIPDILDAQFIDIASIPKTKATPIVAKDPVIKEAPATKKVAEAPVVTEKIEGEPIPKTGAKAVVPITIAKTPEENENFQALKMEVSETAKGQQQHESSSKASAKAQAAAPSPSNERESIAQARQVDVMDEQEAGAFSAAAFKIQLQSRIAEMQLPKDEEEADNFEENNNIAEVNKNAMGDVSGASQESSGAIASATSAKPNTAAAPKRNVAKMPTPKFGKKPTVAGAGKAMPPKRTAAEVEQPLQEQNSTVDNEMAAHGVTDDMLANSNEASFTGALAEKNAAKAQSDAATQQFRTEEEQEQQNVQQNAQQQTNAQIGGMNAARISGLNKVAGNQKQTASKDSVKRKRIADAINGKYEVTKSKVDAILDQLDTDVAKEFVKGSNVAKKAFEDHIETKMTAYKKERYGDSIFSFKQFRRVGDFFVGLPEEVNEFFVTGREVYIATMDGYIETIANMVATKLNLAKQEIANGKKEVQAYVNSLSPSLRKLGKEAASAIEDKFDSLEQTVNDKKDTLIEALAEQYAANVEGIDARIEELKAANEGLVSKALGALKGVFDFIIKVKNTLTNLLAKIVEVVVAIIADPIGFLSNMMAGVGQGISNFSSNIVKHLQSGLISWLTGAMSGLSITMPEDVFSLKGIFSLSSQIMGFTWQAVRRVGTRVIGEPVMKALETGFELVNILRTEGLAGLWEYIKEQFQDLKATVIDAVMDLIQTQVVQAGIKWLLGLLSPVGAFVKAVMAIIDVVKFFIERAAQIAELVNAFIDSVSAIASGKVGAVAASIEKALGKAVPVVIGLLASILGIGGLARKVIKLFKKIQKRVEKALVKLWKKIKKLAKKFLRKIGFGKKKDKGKEGEQDWDDVRVPFQTEDEKTHTLYFDEKGSETVLMVASNPQTFKAFINEVKIDNDDERLRKAHAKAKSIAGNIDERKKDRVGDDKAKKAKKERDIKSMVKALSKYVAVLFGIDENGLPTTEVLHNSETIGGALMGTRMYAKILTKKGSGGSKPTTVPHKIMDSLLLRKEGKRSYYVRGHMLNHNIHGPGEWYNMTPLSQKGNKNHLRKAEKAIKTAVESGAVVDYTLIVKYDRNVSKISDNQLERAGFKSGKEKEKINSLREAEQYVPEKMILRSYMLKKVNGKYQRTELLVEQTNVQNPVDLDINNYKIKPEKSIVDFKINSIEEIKKNTSLDIEEAKIVKRAANIVDNPLDFNQIITKLPKVTDDPITISRISKILKELNKS